MKTETLESVEMAAEVATRREPILVMAARLFLRVRAEIRIYRWRLFAKKIIKLSKKVDDGKLTLEEYFVIKNKLMKSRYPSTNNEA
jgi:mitochondrial fission protein ELM1